MNNNNAIKPRQWTPGQRARQAQRIRGYKPWLKSTGPKTLEGKQKSSRNAYKHGRYGAEVKAIFSYLAASRLLIKTLARKRKEREAAAQQAGRTALARGQKLFHIIVDAPLPSLKRMGPKDFDFLMARVCETNHGEMTR